MRSSYGYLASLIAMAATLGLTPAAGQTVRVGTADEARFEARAAAIVSQMTLEEKASQLKNDSKAIPRLRIPAYNWWSEGLHGVARAGEATVFPQAIGLAATWNVALIRQAADVISTEFRAKYNGTVGADGGSTLYRGLTVWSPNVNIFRDPRWGERSGNIWRGSLSDQPVRFAPAARGSGIPQVMAATGDPDHAMGALVSAKTVIIKLALTIGTLLVGASTGREGPTVQVAASIMGYAHRLMAIPLRASVFIAGGLPA